jgi:hypothetical protein
MNWAKLVVAIGVTLEIFSPALPDGVPGSPRTLLAAFGAALIVAGIYEGAPVPPQIPGSKPSPS